MKNKYFDDEQLSYNDLCFVCYMIERVARRMHQRGCYVVDRMGTDGLWHELSIASVSHAMNPLEVEDRWVEDYVLEQGNIDVTIVNPELETRVPTALQMGKVYARLIASADECDNMPDTICSVYKSSLSEVIDDYDTGCYYEPSYVHMRELMA